MVHFVGLKWGKKFIQMTNCRQVNRGFLDIKIGRRLKMKNQTQTGVNKASSIVAYFDVASFFFKKKYEFLQSFANFSP